MQLNLDTSVDSFAKEVQNICGVNVYDCYQCGKCSAGCTVAEFLTDTPTKLIRLIQLNQKETVLQSQTPFLCATCSICSSRCPMELDIAKLMESLRILSREESDTPAVKEVAKFSDSFLSSVKSHGKTFEFGMLIEFNMRNFTPLKDALFGPLMIQRGKLSFLPRNIKNKKRLKEIFSKSKSE